MKESEVLAFSPEVARQAMLRGLIVPPDLANSAFQTLRKQINAKSKKYFADKGQVVDEREDDDNDAQLRATDQVFAIAGLYAPKAQAQAPALGFALEIDPATGVVRLVAGNAPIQVPEPLALPVKPRAKRARHNTHYGKREKKDKPAQ